MFAWFVHSGTSRGIRELSLKYVLASCHLLYFRKKFLSHFRRISGLLDPDAKLVRITPEQLDTFGVALAGTTFAVMLVPDLHPVLFGYEDDSSGLKRDRPAEQDPPLCIDLLYDDLVSLRHLPECRFDLLVHDKKGFGHSLPGDSQQVGNRD